jgi:hypothetical protein
MALFNPTSDAGTRYFDAAVLRRADFLRFQAVMGQYVLAVYLGVMAYPPTRYALIGDPVIKVVVGVNPHVAVSTKRHEIIFLVATEVTSVLNVVDLKVLLATALLATPAVSVQYLFPKLLV